MMLFVYHSVVVDGWCMLIVTKVLVLYTDAFIYKYAYISLGVCVWTEYIDSRWDSNVN